MLSSCQHSSLARCALFSPHLCFPPISRGSSQALPIAHALAPLELFRAPAPAHSHSFFKLMTAAKGSPAAFRGVNTSLTPQEASLQIWVRLGFANQKPSECPPSPWNQWKCSGLIYRWIPLTCALFISLWSFTAHLSTPCDCILSHFRPCHPSRSLTLRSFPELSLSVTVPIQCNQPAKPFTPTICTRAITANPLPGPLEILSLGSPTASSPAAKPHHPLTSFSHSLTHHFLNWLPLAPF